MRFDKFDYVIDKKDVYILPTIRISKQYEMYDRNFNIQFHFMMFHCRWRWLEVKEQPEYEEKNYEE